MSPLVIPGVGTPTPVVPTDTCDTTLADAINRTRGLLLTNRREEVNKLDGTINDSVDTLDVTYAVGGVQPQARITVDFEHMFVWSVDGKTATVERGYDGTTPAPHDDGAIVRVNPRQSDFDIRNAINDTLRELSAPGCGLYAVYELDLAYVAGNVGYDLTNVTNLLDVLDIYWQADSTTLDWHKVNDRYWSLQRNADTTAFTSGFNLSFTRGFGMADGDPIRVTYKGPYTHLADYDDNVQDVSGLHCDAHDLLWIGAALRLAETREIERNQTMSQGEPRRGNEVPAGAQLNSIRGLRQRWTDRVAAEAGRLTRNRPVYYR